jgi:hypothetical protein
MNRSVILGEFAPRVKAVEREIPRKGRSAANRPSLQDFTRWLLWIK